MDDVFRQHVNSLARDIQRLVDGYDYATVMAALFTCALALFADIEQDETSGDQPLTVTTLVILMEHTREKLRQAWLSHQTTRES